MSVTIGVIGGGFVGRAVARGFLEHAKEVRVYDCQPERATHSRLETWQSDFVFICVPTPAGKNGKPDNSIVTAAICDFCKLRKISPGAFGDPCVVIRSTVRPGYTEYAARMIQDRKSGQLLAPPLGVVHSPEFLTARCALTDFATPARNIIGRVPPTDINGLAVDAEIIAASKRAADKLRALYQQRFPGVAVHEMTSTESELTKVAMNSFFAVKVDFFNLLRQICDATGSVDFETVKAGMLADGRIAHAHTAAPGPDGKPGFGGACLPKDLLNLATYAGDRGIGGGVLLAAHLHNFSIRGPVDETLPQGFEKFG